MARTQRYLNLARVYGFPRDATREEMSSTVEGRAILALGPLRAFYSQSRGTWTLDQKPCQPSAFVYVALRLGLI